jgi:excisionase family DNA binding protein
MNQELRISRRTPFDALPELLTPEECRVYLGTGRGTCFDLLRRGEIPSVRFGKLIRVPKMGLPRARVDNSSAGL